MHNLYLFMNTTTISNLSEFKEFIESYNGHLVIEFYADWCGPCKIMNPIYDNLSTAPEVSHLAFLKINRDNNQEIIDEYSFEVPSIPRFFVCNVQNKSLVQIIDLHGTQSKTSLMKKIIDIAPKDLEANHDTQLVNTNEHSKKRVAIIGSGPAGLTSAIYTSRAQLDVTVYTGLQPGGQLTTTTEIENFPGAWSEEHKSGTDGTQLVTTMQRQAENFGAEFIIDTVKSVNKNSDGTFDIHLPGDRIVNYDAVIIATGASPKYLGIPGEEKLVGKGYHSCATCDGFFYRGKEVIVVGGGDSAMEDSMFLTRFANKVYIINRSDSYRASKIMLDRAQNNPKIEFIEHAVITQFSVDDNGKVNGVTLQDTRDSNTRSMSIDGVFVAIGHEPNSKFLGNLLESDNMGYLIPQWRVSPEMRVSKFDTATKIPGLFVAGDIEDSVYRQAITAAGDGCKAAIDCERWLESMD